eukprot:CAMPEP_0117024954 /NCGR_PEP_ID=MMETSP0472-20121206/18486_1 /TAXON_ID=693140 ORGANISM="Tiarina fusus, Strain LIS" /NCGR_SAMPLE_ID=MMETSP0472 /ASSEMBLY_ACC=CAM_ASM_000603 /LENGTH=403 /DNA_ID=CAMNT_0004731543 /DNA_START=34 /DNA_END=1245 /DNA_ORIENTATION=+
MSGKCPVVNVETLKSEIRAALINDKAFACPIACRVAWHAAGTYCKETNTGGSDGARMRFEPEISDPANAGLGIVRDMLHEVQKAHPEVSEADFWTLAGCSAIEFMGGPKIPHRLGRTDDADGSKCPANGRLPDAAQGADHIREVFGRMGFNDREMVALIGAHTVGRCHIARSGFDGPWTHNPLVFDNSYFTNLLNLDWVEKKWHAGYDGPLQFTDKETETLLMLPADMALKTDPEFRKFAEIYAKDQNVFFADFSAAFAKLVSLGCPAECQPDFVPEQSEQEKASASFRECCMHGSLGPVMKWAETADVHAVEAATSRSGLHKAAYWGHIDTVKYLVNDLKLKIDGVDNSGDTALHDAARFGHEAVAKFLVEAGADKSIKNKDGMTAADVAKEYKKDSLLAFL